MGNHNLDNFGPIVTETTVHTCCKIVIDNHGLRGTVVEVGGPNTALGSQGPLTES